MLGCLDKNTQTHNRGGHLDQVFTNIQGLTAITEDSDITDHKLIRVQIRFIKDPEDVDIDNMPTTIK